MDAKSEIAINISTYIHELIRFLSQLVKLKCTKDCNTQHRTSGYPGTDVYFYYSKSLHSAALLAQVVLYIILQRKELLYHIIFIIQNYSILLLEGGSQYEVHDMKLEGICYYLTDDQQQFDATCYICKSENNKITEANK